MAATAESVRVEQGSRSGASQVALVVAQSEGIAKNIESYLRNAGHPVRCGWVSDPEDVENALRAGTPDLLICAESTAAVPPKDVIELGRRLMPDLPIVVLSEHVTPEDTVAALAAGASDLVSDEDLRHMRHLELVVLRELARHKHLRELRSTRQRLADFESRHQQLVASTNDAVAHIQEGIISEVNPAFAQLLGYEDPGELSALPLMDLVPDDQQPKVKEHLKLLRRGKADGKPLECCLVHKDGRRISINARLTQSVIDGEHLIEMLIPSEGPKVDAAASGDGGAVAAPAAHGRLTYFDALAPAIVGAGQQKDKRAVVMIAVDDFPGTEERLGLHDAVQAVDQCAEWIQTRLGAQDQLYRFSTHEIACILARPALTEILDFGESLVRDVGKQIFNTAGHEAHLALTVAAYPLAGSEQVATMTAELVRDTRQLSAKGGNKFANVGPSARSSLEEVEDVRKSEMIRKALEANRLKIAYQSIASLEGDTRQHFDVLVRVIDENGTELHAAEFIRAAEKHGLMPAIDRWVTARALKVQAKREGAQDASSLFVKLSQDTLKEAEAFVAWFGEQLKSRPLKPGEVVFELREQIVQNHIRKARMLTKALSDLGAQITIEHFGVGSNSAQMIEHIPMQFIKFHQSFTANFSDKELHHKMVVLMEQAKQKGIKIIVSHVEDANVMARLWQMGVNFIQGYHVQEPEVVLLSADVR